MTRRTRLAITLAVAALAGVIALLRARAEPSWPTDFDQLWFAARALFDGRDPYALVGPGTASGRAFVWPWPLYYPLPAVLLVAPLALVPLVAARVVFATLSAGVLAWAITRDGWWRLPLLLSASMLIAIWRSQWTMLITAAAFLPWLGVALAAKPNIGLVVASSVTDRRRLGWLAAGAVAIVVVSVLILPAWPREWLSAIRDSPHVRSPVLRFGGALALLALLRWRRPEARVLVAQALVPHTPSLYDLLPLFLVPRTLRQTALLALASDAMFATVVVLGPFETFDGYASMLGRLEPWFMMLPALAMALMTPHVQAPAPNDGAAPPARPLGRLDAGLLALLVFCAVLLVWLTAVTRRL